MWFTSKVKLAAFTQTREDIKIQLKLWKLNIPISLQSKCSQRTIKGRSTNAMHPVGPTVSIFSYFLTQRGRQIWFSWPRVFTYAHQIIIIIIIEMIDKSHWNMCYNKRLYFSWAFSSSDETLYAIFVSEANAHRSLYDTRHCNTTQGSQWWKRRWGIQSKII